MRINSHNNIVDREQFAQLYIEEQADSTLAIEYYMEHKQIKTHAFSPTEKVR
jgi:hypothetical protein